MSWLEVTRCGVYTGNKKCQKSAGGEMLGDKRSLTDVAQDTAALLRRTKAVQTETVVVGTYILSRYVLDFS